VIKPFITVTLACDDFSDFVDYLNTVLVIPEIGDFVLLMSSNMNDISIDEYHKFLQTSGMIAAALGIEININEYVHEFGKELHHEI